MSAKGYLILIPTLDVDVKPRLFGFNEIDVQIRHVKCARDVIDPLRKALNAILTESSVIAKPQRPWGWPTHLMVEPTNHCNLHCALCPVTDGFERAQGMMDFSLFTRLLDEVGAYVFTLQL